MAIVVALAGSARADDAPSYTALPCRPTIACTADFVPPGALELETGYIYRRLAGGVNQSSLPVLGKLTVASWAQLQVGTNGPTLQGDTRYLDDLTAGVKVRLHRQTESVPSLSVSATLSVPTFAASGYLRTYDALLVAYVTKDIGWVHADWNLGANVWRVEDAPITQAWTALALSVAIGRGFGAMLEGYTFSDAAPIAPRDAGMLSAISYQPSWWCVLDLGGDLGLTSTRAASLFVGMTLIAGRLW